MGGPMSGRRRLNACLHEFEKISISDFRVELELPKKVVRLEHYCLVVGGQTIQVGYGLRGTPVWLPVTVEYSTPNYGGARAWFLCPTCAARRNDLYFTGGIFECRVCTGASYRSEGESYSARMRRRWVAIAHLVHPKAVLPTFPTRPKGMSSKRYERLKSQADGLEHRYVKATDLHARVDSIEAGRYQKLR
jgi:hypothetical protein